MRVRERERAAGGRRDRKRQARAEKAEELYKWVEVTSNAKVVELVIDGDICMIKASGRSRLTRLPF